MSASGRVPWLRFLVPVVVIAIATGIALPSTSSSEEPPPSREKTTAAVASAETDPTENESDGLLLRVFLPDNIRPAAGATVELLHLDDVDRAARAEADGYGEALIREHGIELRTDEKGEVRLPPLRKFGAWIQASLGSHWGRIEPQGVRDDQLILQLREERTLTIRTVDERGVPKSGVPVGLFIRTSGIDWTDVRRVWRGVTAGAKASCVVPHLDWFLQDCPRFRGIRRSLLFASLDVIMLEAPRFVLDPNHPPEEPVTFEAPALGAVTAHVTEHDGTPIEGETRVGLRFADLDARDWESDSRTYPWQATVDGSAHFERVELDRTFIVVGDNRGREHAESNLQGPTLPGERADTTIRLGAPRTIYSITMRIVDDEGEPLRERPLAIHLEREISWAVRLKANETTDASGRVRIDAGTSTGTFPIHLRVPFADEASRGAFDREWAGETTVELSGPDAEIDAGDIRLRRVPVLIAGIVVDEAGNPVEGANVGTFIVTTSGKYSYDTKSGTDGSFTLHGEHSDSDLRVWVGRTNYERAGPFTVTPATPDCRFVMKNATRLVGRVLALGQLESEYIRTTIETSKGRENVVLWGNRIMHRTIPGPAKLRFHVGRQVSPVKVLGGIEIIEGQTTDIGEIRLGEGLAVGEVTTIGPAGEPIRSATIWSRTAEQEPALLGTADTQGGFRFATDSVPIEILAYADGTRLARATFTGDPLRVVLAPGIPVRFRFAGDADAIQWTRIEPELRPVAPASEQLPKEKNSILSQGYEKKPGGSFRCVLAVPGVYEVTWQLYRYGPFRVDGERVPCVLEPIGEPTRITVLDSQTEQVFPFSLDPADIATARKRLDAHEPID